MFANIIIIMYNLGWWLVLGIPEKNELVSIKRVNMAKRITSVALDFVAPDAGKYQYKLFFMSKFIIQLSLRS